MWKNEVGGILFDLDGVFYVGDRRIPGALDALEFLDERGIPYCFITNTTTQSAAELQDKLAELGIPCQREQLITAPVATADYLLRQGVERCFFAVNESVLADFSAFRPVDENPDAVVLGDIGDRWSYSLLDCIFQHLLGGAALVAMHRNKYWQKSGGLHIDIGAFVAGLEYVADIEAVITGKPTKTFFDAALGYLGIDSSQALLVGDDIHSDIGGAQSAGIRAALVKTGKYRADLVARSGIEPEFVLQSIAEFSDMVLRR